MWHWCISTCGIGITKFQLYIYIYIAISYLTALQGPSGPQVCAKEDNVGKLISASGYCSNRKCKDQICTHIKITRVTTV